MFDSKQADLNFIKAARDVATSINSVTLQSEMNKQFARVALSDDDLIEKVDRELNKIKVAAGPVGTAAPGAGGREGRDDPAPTGFVSRWAGR